MYDLIFMCTKPLALRKLSKDHKTQEMSREYILQQKKTSLNLTQYHKTKN